MCFVWISAQTAIISLYSIKWLVLLRVNVYFRQAPDFLHEVQTVFVRLVHLGYLVSLLERFKFWNCGTRANLMTFWWSTVSGGRSDFSQLKSLGKHESLTMKPTIWYGIYKLCGGNTQEQACCAWPLLLRRCTSNMNPLNRVAVNREDTVRYCA